MFSGDLLKRAADANSDIPVKPNDMQVLGDSKLAGKY